jgi:hypothetical protein
MLDDVRHLAEAIGPRGTGTPEEAAAADYVAGRLHALGLSHEGQAFQTVASQNVFPLTVDLLALLSVLIYPLSRPISSWAAAALGLVTAPLLWRSILYSDSPFSSLLARKRSQNVVTRISPQARLGQRAVVLAHLDTNRCRLAWQSSTVRYLEPLTWLTLAVLFSIGTLHLTGAILGGPLGPWLATMIPAAYVIATVVTLWKDDRTPFSPGAHDNAASVAVALELVPELIDKPLDHTEVWLAFTGAEETDHAGLKTLLKDRREVLRRAVFIDLEGVGSGDIVYLARQGLCRHYYPDPALLAVARRVAGSRPEWKIEQAEMLMEDEVRTLRQHGYQALGIAGRDPSTGSLPFWHRADDTADKVSDKVMRRAADFVTAILREIDASDSSNPEDSR